MSGGLLLDERMVSAQPSLIRELGLTRAVVLQQIHWNMVYGHGEEREGETWYPVTCAVLADEVGLGEDVAYRAVRSLEADGLLLSCQPEGRQSRRKWYRIDYAHRALSDSAIPRDGSPRFRGVPSRDSAASSSCQPLEQETSDELTLVVVAETSRATTEELFAYWQSATDHPRARLDTKRRKRIDWARANYDDDEIRDAIAGVAASAFHQGDNPSRTRYDDLTLILRDADHLERFRDLHRETTHDDAMPSNPANHRWFDEETGASGA